MQTTKAAIATRKEEHFSPIKGLSVGVLPLGELHRRFMAFELGHTLERDKNLDNQSIT